MKYFADSENAFGPENTWASKVIKSFDVSYKC